VKICVVGTGYVGLVVGTCLSESGNDVICVDKDKKKIDSLKRAIPPIHEPGLAELLQRNIKERRLRFSTDIGASVKESAVVFISVGTPVNSDRIPDVTQVERVAAEVAKAMEHYTVIVLKSTVPVGTARRVKKLISRITRRAAGEFAVVSNPEFLKEGAAIDDFMKPDRVIVAADDRRAAEIMRELYSPFLRTNKPFIETNYESAEMTKYASNAFLATKISFMNEIANLCERVGADVNDVRYGVGTDPRIGPHFLFPGVGYGGSCLPKDADALIHVAKRCKYPLKILSAVREVNRQQKRLLVRKMISHFGGKVAGKRVAIWGLAFKPRTDDIREAPSLVVIEELLNRGAKVSAYDPAAMENTKLVFGKRVRFAATNYDALKDADCLMILTEWNEFRNPSFDRMKSLMKNPVVLDGRNIFDRKTVESLGFTYYAIGC
jgi:UDPglucose 6-dehydrogenase